MSAVLLVLSLYLPWIVFLGVMAQATVASPKKTVEKRRASDLKIKANVRKTFPAEAELRALGRSVIKRQIHPLIIFGDIILDGECRWRGVMLENPDHELDVIVVDREMTAAEVCELQLVSALHSTTLTSYDQALACKEWMAANPQATAKELAEKIDRDSSMVGILLSLFNCDPAVLKAAEEGKIGPMAWKPIALLPHDQQAELLEMHLAGIPAAKIAQISRQRRNGYGKGDTTRLDRCPIPLPSGVQVTVAGKNLSLADLITALSEAMTEAKAAAAQMLDIKTLAVVARDKAKKKATIPVENAKDKAKAK